jgi:kumamolisin
MENSTYFKLAGTFKPRQTGGGLQETDPAEVITVTVRLRRKKELPHAAFAGEI